jgi:DNA-binding transcriptional LysR family regulator
MLEWDDLRYFLAFARAGSMQAAGKALGVNQSTVQRRVAELEERVGRRLVERHLGGYRLTELGGELRPAAESVESAVAAFERRLAACDKGPTGTIRVTCGTILANRLQRTPLIDLFHKRNPGLRRAYVKRHGRPERPADIERHFVVDCVAEHPGAQWLRSVAPRATIVSRADNHPGLILAVRSGAGLAALIRTWSQKRLCSATARKGTHGTWPWPVNIATLKNRTLSPVVGRFIEHLRDVTRPMREGRPALKR